jgi:hypothetical protein
VPDTGLSRYCERKWKEFSVGDRVGVLAYAWTGCPFWNAETEFQMFEDLRKLRNALTHPKPAGIERSRRIVSRRKVKGFTSTIAKAVGSPRVLNPEHLTHGKKAVAQFATSPFAIGHADAEQAVEILLCHMARFDERFFGRGSTRFAMFDETTGKLKTARDLLNGLPRKFASEWP